MRIARLLVTLCLWAWLTTAHAGSVQCVPDAGCPKGVKPPACCQPPPCEFFEQIKMKQNLRRFYNNAEVNAALIKQAKGDNDAAAALLNAWVRKKAAGLGKQLRCQWEAPYGYPGTFETKSWCQIVADMEDGQQAMSREQAYQRFDTCKEFIDAIYDHEGHHKEICAHTNSSERAHMGLTAYAAEERAGYRLEIESLKARLTRYWSACSAVASADTARQIAKAGVSTLKKKTAPKGKGKGKQKRSPAKKAAGQPMAVAHGGWAHENDDLVAGGVWTGAAVDGMCG